MFAINILTEEVIISKNAGPKQMKTAKLLCQYSIECLGEHLENSAPQYRRSKEIFPRSAVFRKGCFSQMPQNPSGRTRRASVRIVNSRSALCYYAKQYPSHALVLPRPLLRPPLTPCFYHHLPDGKPERVGLTTSQPRERGQLPRSGCSDYYSICKWRHLHRPPSRRHSPFFGNSKWFLLYKCRLGSGVLFRCCWRYSSHPRLPQRNTSVPAAIPA